MNWRRGLFRLWIVGAVLFVFAITLVSYGVIKQQFEETGFQQWAEAHSEMVLPVLCGNVRGVAGTDYSTKQGQTPGPWDIYSKPNPYDNCWYTMSEFRALFPEYNDLSDNELSRKLYADHGVPTRDLPNPWVTLATWASIALGIPLVVLVLGASLAWAFSGFSAKQP
jgi:hypothetical protein